MATTAKTSKPKTKTSKASKAKAPKQEQPFVLREGQEYSCRRPSRHRSISGPVWADGNHYHLTSFSPPVPYSWSQADSYSPQQRRALISGVARYVDSIMGELRALHGEEVSLLGAGISGALLVPSVADHLGVPFALMRAREATRSASGRAHAEYTPRLVGYLAPCVLLLDDLIDTGATVRDVYVEVATYGARLRGMAVMRSWYGNVFSADSYGYASAFWRSNIYRQDGDGETYLPIRPPECPSARGVYGDVIIWDAMRQKATDAPVSAPEGNTYTYREPY